MKKKLTYLALGIALVGFYVGLTELVMTDTTKMMESQTELLKKRTSGEMAAEEYTSLSRSSEKEYRTSIAGRIKLLVQEIKWIASLADKLGVGTSYREKIGLESNETNVSVEMTALAENLEKKGEEFGER